MQPIRHILAALDFSPDSQAALDAAVELARRLGATIRVFHAYHLPIGTMYDYSLPGKLREELRRAAQQRLDAALERVVAQGVKADAELAEGVPSEAIVEAAERLKADLVVMGTRGLTGLRHAVLGSVAERTVRHAPCPVLTVRRPTA